MKNEKKGKKLDFKSLVKKTMHITPDLDKALRVMAAIEDKAEYEIVIEALGKHIPEKYFEMAKDKK